MTIIGLETEGGTAGFITTPHVMESPDLGRVGLFQERLLGLKQRVAEAGIALELHPGAEVYPFMGALKAIDDGVPLTLAGSGKYVLVDTPFNQLPHDFEDFLFGLQTRGITPILAHPERSNVFQADPEVLLKFVKTGVVLQVNAGSLKSRYGPVAKQFAERLLERRLAHIVASDTHRPGRSPALGSFAADEAGELGAEYVRMLTIDSPRAIVNGQTLPLLPTPPPEKPSGWFRRLVSGDKNLYRFG